MPIDFELVWFDSFGAKSSCTLVRTDNITVLIDPGVAIMHPTFPASWAKKAWWVEQGWREIKKAAKEADLVVISHYHWDHFSPEDMDIYKGKLILAKNPNHYINDSQRKRAMNFYEKICATFGGEELKLKEPEGRTYTDPTESLKSVKKEHGDYDERRQELLLQGKRWFENRVRKWKNYKIIPEMRFDEVEIRFAEGKVFTFGNTKIRFTNALFHGIEYSRVGWVFMTIIEHKREKFVHSSDVDGPIIEDYADIIIRENPKYLVLDGPMTYMLGYTLNNINLNRTIENACRIVEKVDFDVMIWDHHLPREPNFREHTKKVWMLAEKLEKNMTTAREFRFNKMPVVEELAGND